MNYDHIARRALELYGLTGAEISLLGHSDKRVYLAVHGPDRFVLPCTFPLPSARQASANNPICVRKRFSPKRI